MELRTPRSMLPVSSFSFLAPLPALTEIIEKSYRVVGREHLLDTLILAHDVMVVAGAYFGDEAKGKMIDAIARHELIRLIMRTNSGENAGHTVYDKHGRKFVFHLAPSGLLLPGKINLVGQNCEIDPVSFLETELSPLIQAGHDYHDRLFVGNAHIATPYHKILDMLGDLNSSTLKGMSDSHASKVKKKGLRLNDLSLPESRQKELLEKDLRVYDAFIEHRHLDRRGLIDLAESLNQEKPGRIPEHVMEFIHCLHATRLDYLIDLYRKTVSSNEAFPRMVDSARMVQDFLARGEKVLLESAQSFFLSNAEGHFWRSSTSADTTAAGTIASAGYNTSRYSSVVINVAKAPISSRVGAGENPSGFVPQNFFAERKLTKKDIDGLCTDYDSIQKAFFLHVSQNGILEPITYTDSTGTYSIDAAIAIAASNTHGEVGATTGKPRITGLFDCVAHAVVDRAQGPYLVLSAMDRGDLHDQVGLTVGYVIYNPENTPLISNGVTYAHGDIIKPGDQLPGEEILHFCHPITKVLPGWKDTPISATHRNIGDPLPSAVQRYAAEVSHYTGATVIALGNGKHTDNVIYVAAEP